MLRHVHEDVETGFKLWRLSICSYHYESILLLEAMHHRVHEYVKNGISLHPQTILGEYELGKLILLSHSAK